MNIVKPIVWPRDAYDELEAQLKGGIRAQIAGQPLERLSARIDEAVKAMFVGVRVVKPGRRGIAVRSQTVELRMEIVDTKDGASIRRREIDIHPIEVSWPE